jgi:hypothetical protein
MGLRLIAGLRLRRILRLRLLGRCALGGRLIAALDNLVQFTAIEPDTPALRALIDLDPLSFAHGERSATIGAEHSSLAIHAATPLLLKLI